MTTKWTIRKYDRGSYPWKVFAPGVDAPSSPGLATYASRFGGRSYESALRYANDQIAKADRKARTVEVELPKVEKSKCIDPSMSPVMFVAKTPGNYGVFLGHRYMIAVTAEELKPLGEYLLALHYEKENQ